MTVSPADATSHATLRRSLAMLLTWLAMVGWGPAATVRAQGAPRAAANQLHAAIVNGDVESLRYWLTVRHADASAANAEEPDVTPLERCVGLAARTLVAPPDTDRGAPGPVVSLRALQDMATLLHQHGARLTAAERSQFAEPVLRWYDDAVSTPTAPAHTRAEPARTAADPSGTPAIAFGGATVLVRTEPRESCNGNGHAVYLVNQKDLSITANVTIHEDAAGATTGRERRETHAVDADGSWRLGCDVSKDGHDVRYVLNDWR
jgi:hypothetical protein